MTQTSADIDFDGSQSLKDLMLYALNAGIDALKKQGTLLPMVITETAGKYGITVLTAASARPDEMVKGYIRNLTTVPDAYAVVLEGKVPIEIGYVEAVIVFAREKGKPHGHRAYHAYKRGF